MNSHSRNDKPASRQALISHANRSSSTDKRQAVFHRLTSPFFVFDYCAAVHRKPLMSIFSVTEIRKEKQRSKAEERELLKAERRNYKDLRWAVIRFPITASEWGELLTLHGKHGKEGGRQLAHHLIPEWNLCQERIPGGCTIPAELWEQWKPEAVARTSSRKVRSDEGRARK